MSGAPGGGAHRAREASHLRTDASIRRASRRRLRKASAKWSTAMIKQDGRDAPSYEVGYPRAWRPELVKLLGRHALPHELRAERAAAIRLRSRTLCGHDGGRARRRQRRSAKRAGLLHDIGKAHGRRRSRARTCSSASTSRSSYKESRRKSSTRSRRTTATWSRAPLRPAIVQAADAISAARPWRDAARTSRTTSSGSRSSRRSAYCFHGCREVLTPSRRAEKSA